MFLKMFLISCLKSCLISLLFTFFIFRSQAQSPPNPIKQETYEQMLMAADNIRNPAESYQMKIVVEDGSRSSTFEVSIEGPNKTLIVTLEPPRDAGRNMLMLERDFYAYIPNLKKAMRLSLAQKLSGQVANGDISRTRWYGDYSVSFERTEGDAVVLMLKALKPNLTYNQIRLWLQKENSFPLRAEYLNLDGSKVLKRAFFEEPKSLEGGIRPSVIRIEDMGESKSYIRIQSMKKAKFNESHFTVRNLESLR